MKIETQLAPVALTITSDLGLDTESIAVLHAQLQPFFVQAEDWRQKALAIKVESADDKRSMKFARESRLALRECRIKVEKWRKEAKEESLRKGRAIDGLANIFKDAVEPIEAHLLGLEQYGERLEAERLEALGQERYNAIHPYVREGQMVPALNQMTDEQWGIFFEDTKAAHEARIERERRIEQERIEAELAAAKERERIRLENEQLKREAAEREAAAAAESARIEKERAAERQKAEREAAAAAEVARKERAAIEAKAKAEREAAEKKAAVERAAREKAEREARELREADELRKLQEAEAAAAAEHARQLAAEKALTAPDKQKLMDFANSVRAIQVPACKAKAAQKVAAEITAKVEAFAKWIEAQAAPL